MAINSQSLQFALRNRLLNLIRHGDLKPNQAEGLEVLASLCRPLYIPITKECDPNKLDRSSSFLFGFPWTSDEFPWPDRCEEECFGDSFHAPVLQLNRDEVSASIGEHVGSGLFQVFLPMAYDSAYGRDGNGIDACVRIIPASVVARKWNLTRFPLERMSALEACQYLGHAGVPDSYDDLEDDNSYLENTGTDDTWCLYKVESNLMREGIPSDGYSIGPATAIVGWVPHIPEAHVEISRLSDKSLRRLFAEWEPLGEYDLESNFDNLEIMCELFAAEWPRPALFGWPRAVNAQLHAIHRRQMPLIVFDGIWEEDAGDWIEVFQDDTFWTFGYYT